MCWTELKVTVVLVWIVLVTHADTSVKLMHALKSINMYIYISKVYHHGKYRDSYLGSMSEFLNLKKKHFLIDVG